MKHQMNKELKISTLAKAIDLATQRHDGQYDKAGQDYILHPLRVMQKLDSEQTQIVAVLHDILEDTTTTVEELQILGFSDEIIEAICALTKQEHENRFQAAQRTVRNRIACSVKLADVSDNMDLSRLAIISKKDLKRQQQYRKVHAILTHADQFYKLLEQYDLDEYYPKFSYETQQDNFQYLLNAWLDHEHPLGGVALNLAQEWWIVFEDVSFYLSFCLRKQKQPLKAVFLNLINQTDDEFLGSIFQDESSQTLFSDFFERLNLIFFNKV